MKVLILTANTGEGHNQTAKALIEEFSKYGHECEAVNSLNFLSEKRSDFLCGWHLRLYRHMPKPSAIGYSFIDRFRSPLEKPGGIFYKYFARGGDKLNEIIKAKNIDLVISVHPFASIIICEFQLKHKETKVKTAFIPTDYTCSPGAPSGDIDVYFIPHPDLKEEFIRRGVSEEKLYPTYGIPVKKSFFNAPSKAEAKKYLGIKEDEKCVLLACGSMGCGPISKLTKKLAAVLPKNTKLFVICGTNDVLYKKLTKKNYGENINIIQFTDKMLYYIVSADVYISKPGGISSTEAAILGAPTLLINAVGGCETYNYNFFVNHGSAKTAKNLKGFVNLTLSILNGESVFGSDAEKLKKEFSKNSAETIAAYYKNSNEEVLIPDENN